MISTLFSAVFLLLLITKPSICMNGCAKGLTLWYKQLLPSLFPAMAAASILISRKSIQVLLKKLPFTDAVVFFSALICGNPMGALTCSSLCSSNLISIKKSRWLICFVQIPSPMFLFGFCASSVLGLHDASIFAFCAYLPFFCSFVFFLLLNILSSKKERSCESALLPEPSFDSVCDTCLLLLVRIGILMMLFSIIAELLQDFISSYSFFADICMYSDVCIGLLEMTTGITKLGSSLLPTHARCALCLFLLGYGGLCIHIQIFNAWQHEKFPWLRYELVRISSGLCSCFVYLLLI